MPPTYVRCPSFVAIDYPFIRNLVLRKWFLFLKNVLGRRFMFPSKKESTSVHMALSRIVEQLNDILLLKILIRYPDFCMLFVRSNAY